ncbi:MAG: precorrin-3B C(17)-methyltransferase [Ruminococcaceae bacterium]|jgi:precorrin-3B C17-methyltransferase|nr:precorrin-3B C(17)-methyltransferase [Oscillospiraceae bacterium]
MNRLYIVGIGPGKRSGMTMEADEALRRADVIVGYSKYVELVRPYYPDKRFHDTGMTRERERCAEALRLAREGETVALVCSGDSVVYGMAGLIYELAGEAPGVELQVIPGVTAALSGGAILGAPLGHDFAVISLSDLLTPWETIEKRLRCAAAGDLCMSLYNPGSHRRTDYLQRACDILLETLPPETVCGMAREIGRAGENWQVTTLGRLRDTPVDMFTTVYIGNSMTRVISGKMVTPRGYRLD